LKLFIDNLTIRDYDPMNCTEGMLRRIVIPFDFSILSVPGLIAILSFHLVYKNQTSQGSASYPKSLLFLCGAYVMIY